MAKPRREEREEVAGFEKSLERLEEIAARLEAGDAPLEETIKLYEEGIRIQRSCAKLLAAAKLRIEELTQEPQKADSTSSESRARARNDDPEPAGGSSTSDPQEKIPF